MQTFQPSDWSISMDSHLNWWWLSWRKLWVSSSGWGSSFLELSIPVPQPDSTLWLVHTQRNSLNNYRMVDYFNAESMAISAPSTRCGVHRDYGTLSNFHSKTPSNETQSSNIRFMRTIVYERFWMLYLFTFHSYPVYSFVWVLRQVADKCTLHKQATHEFNIFWSNIHEVWSQVLKDAQKILSFSPLMGIRSCSMGRRTPVGHPCVRNLEVRLEESR